MFAVEDTKSTERIRSTGKTRSQPDVERRYRDPTLPVERLGLDEIAGMDIYIYIEVALWKCH